MAVNACQYIKAVKRTLPGLRDFYMAGQWVMPGGGTHQPVLVGMLSNCSVTVTARSFLGGHIGNMVVYLLIELRQLVEKSKLKSKME